MADRMADQPKKSTLKSFLCPKKQPTPVTQRLSGQTKENASPYSASRFGWHRARKLNKPQNQAPFTTPAVPARKEAATNTSPHQMDPEQPTGIHSSQADLVAVLEDLHKQVAYWRQLAVVRCQTPRLSEKPTPIMTGRSSKMPSAYQNVYGCDLETPRTTRYEYGPPCDEGTRVPLECSNPIFSLHSPVIDSSQEVWGDAHTGDFSQHHAGEVMNSAVAPHYRSTEGMFSCQDDLIMDTLTPHRLFIGEDTEIITARTTGHTAAATQLVPLDPQHSDGQRTTAAVQSGTCSNEALVVEQHEAGNSAHEVAMKPGMQPGGQRNHPASAASLRNSRVPRLCFAALSPAKCTNGSIAPCPLPHSESETDTVSAELSDRLSADSPSNEYLASGPLTERLVSEASAADDALDPIDYLLKDVADGESEAGAATYDVPVSSRGVCAEQEATGATLLPPAKDAAPLIMLSEPSDMQDLQPAAQEGLQSSSMAEKALNNLQQCIDVMKTCPSLTSSPNRALTARSLQRSSVPSSPRYMFTARSTWVPLTGRPGLQSAKLLRSKQQELCQKQSSVASQPSMLPSLSGSEDGEQYKGNSLPSAFYGQLLEHAWVESCNDVQQLKQAVVALQTMHIHGALAQQISDIAAPAKILSPIGEESARGLTPLGRDLQELDELFAEMTDQYQQVQAEQARLQERLAAAHDVDIKSAAVSNATSPSAKPGTPLDASSYSLTGVVPQTGVVPPNTLTKAIHTAFAEAGAIRATLAAQLVDFPTPVTLPAHPHTPFSQAFSLHGNRTPTSRAPRWLCPATAPASPQSVHKPATFSCLPHSPAVPDSSSAPVSKAPSLNVSPQRCPVAMPRSRSKKGPVEVPSSNAATPADQWLAFTAAADMAYSAQLTTPASVRSVWAAASSVTATPATGASSKGLARAPSSHASLPLHSVLKHEFSFKLLSWKLTEAMNDKGKLEQQVSDLEKHNQRLTADTKSLRIANAALQQELRQRDSECKELQQVLDSLQMRMLEQAVDQASDTLYVPMIGPSPSDRVSEQQETLIPSPCLAISNTATPAKQVVESQLSKAAGGGTGATGNGCAHAESCSLSGPQLDSVLAWRSGEEACNNCSPASDNTDDITAAGTKPIYCECAKKSCRACKRDGTRFTPPHLTKSLDVASGGFQGFPKGPLYTSLPNMSPLRYSSDAGDLDNTLQRAMDRFNVAFGADVLAPRHAHATSRRTGVQVWGLACKSPVANVQERNAVLDIARNFDSIASAMCYQRNSNDGGIARSRSYNAAALQDTIDGGSLQEHVQRTQSACAALAVQHSYASQCLAAVHDSGRPLQTMHSATVSAAALSNGQAGRQSHMSQVRALGRDTTQELVGKESVPGAASISVCTGDASDQTAAPVRTSNAIAMEQTEEVEILAPAQLDDVENDDDLPISIGAKWRSDDTTAASSMQANTRAHVNGSGGIENAGDSENKAAERTHKTAFMQSKSLLTKKPVGQGKVENVRSGLRQSRKWMPFNKIKSTSISKR